MTRISVLVLLLASLASIVASASPPSFCKCTCFSNSTIIPLGKYKESPRSFDPRSLGPNSPDDDYLSAAGTQQTAPSPADDGDDAQTGPVFLDKRVASSSCTQCNRAYCLKNSLPNCKGAEEKDVVTSCFQRDSRKDQIIVWGFIVGTAGLLGWAGLRRILELRDGNKIPLSGILPLGITGANGRTHGASNGGGVERRPPAAGALRPSALSLQVPPGVGARAGARDENRRGAYAPLEHSEGVTGGRGT